jgi:Flp pilus assembly pilin Flp
MLKFIKSFRDQDDGAVTVDWVVLTAAIVGLSVAVIAIVADGATDQSTGVGAALSDQAIMTH